jgi:hypothetical protein
MKYDQVTEVFMCPRCLVAKSESGTCPQCSANLIKCEPGAQDDPCRRPLMSASGQVLSRAPVWWLRNTANPLGTIVEDGRH